MNMNKLSKYTGFYLQFIAKIVFYRGNITKYNYLNVSFCSYKKCKKKILSLTLNL